jgi:hypothetical protein
MKQYPTAHIATDPSPNNTLAIALQFATANMMGAPNAPPGHKDQLYLNVRCCSASRVLQLRMSLMKVERPRYIAMAAAGWQRGGKRQEAHRRDGQSLAIKLSLSGTRSS